MDVLNVRLWDPEVDSFDAGASEALTGAWKSAGWQCRINAAVGCILVHKETERYRYFHASPNEGALLERPRTIASMSSLNAFIEEAASLDVQERAVRRRPNTEWRLYALTNVSFYLYKQHGVSKVGKRDPSDFPDYLLQNKDLLSLLRNPKTGRPYDDNLCFFRCLALAVECRCGTRCRCTLPKQRKVKELFARYINASGTGLESFAGVSESHLDELEMLFDASITVFNMKADKSCDVV